MPEPLSASDLVAKAELNDLLAQIAEIEKRIRPEPPDGPGTAAMREQLGWRQERVAAILRAHPALAGDGAPRRRSPRWWPFGKRA